jgi:hypothetical protein
MNDREYTFEERLGALRLLLGQEHLLPPQEQVYAIHKDFQPLTITLEDWLHEQDYQDRRGTRLAMVGYIIEQEITSFYDLTLHQVRAILTFIRDRETYQLKPWAGDFLAKLATVSQIYRVPETGNPTHEVRPTGESAKVSDL